MIPIKNQPFDFGYNEGCDCNESIYEQFFFNTDIIEVAFDITKCSDENDFNINEADFDTFSGALAFNGNVVTFSGSGALQMLFPNPLAGGLYYLELPIQSYTSGSLEVVVNGTIRYTVTSAGLIGIWLTLANNEPTINFVSNSFNGVVNFDLFFSQFPTNQQAFLVDSANNNVAEMESFRRENQLVFQVNLALLTLTEKCNYKIGWTNECDPYSFDNPEYFTNEFAIIPPESQGCTVALSGCYPGSQFNFPADFNPLVRLSGRLARPQYPIEFVKSRDSQGYTTVNYSDRIKTMQLLLDEVPEYILDFLSVWVAFENMYINGQSYRITEDSFPEITYIDESDFGLVEFQVERVRQLVQRLNCTGAVAPCQEVPPPPNLGAQKLFQDDVEFDFQDDVEFLFE